MVIDGRRDTIVKFSLSRDKTTPLAKRTLVLNSEWCVGALKRLKADVHQIRL
jgi:hypothetical protein